MKMKVHSRRRLASLGMLVLLAALGSSAVALTKPTLSVTRSLVNPHLAFEMDQDSESLHPDCDLQMDRPIVMSHPQSLDQGDRYFVLGSTSYEAVAMTVDYINTKRCGVRVQGKNYPVLLQTLGDDSDQAKHAAAGTYLATRTDFFLAGYSSLLTQHLAPIAQANNKIMVAGGSSRTSIYQDRDHAFGILPPGHLYLDQALQAVATVGAKTVASISEDGLGFICNNVPSLVEKYGLSLTGSYEVAADPTLEELGGVADAMQGLDPDVVVTCTFDGGCARWIQSMREHDWSPKAQVFTLCIGLNELEQQVGQDVTYMMGASSWDKNLPPIPDAVTGWTPREFADNFEAYAFKNATYQNAAAATSVSILVQAIELADSLETDLVQAQLASQTFATMYGKTTFDDNGQNSAPSTLFQYDQDMKLHVVYPPEDRPDDVNLVYPMPSFRKRDCVSLSMCQATGGKCQEDGTCDCSGVELLEILGGDWEQIIAPIGIGPTASCKVLPNESLSFISDTWKWVGYGMVALQAFLSLCAIGWTLYYRDQPVVIASQPMFLILIAVGCLIMVASILPFSVEGEYRYLKNETTGVLTNQTDPNIDRVDAACMAAPWLAGMGFAILFSSLFAKILRIKYMLDHASGYSRKSVEIKDVLSAMCIMIFLELAVLLSWQLVDPMQWQREVLLEDSDGFALQSVGFCQSDNGVAFFAPLVAMNALGLVYALWLCYVTRFVPSDVAEGRWITISVVSIFQILMLAIPILVIANEDPTASFFVRAAVVFLTGSSVTLLVFVPKMRALAFGQENDGNAIRVRFKEAVELHKEAKSSWNNNKDSRSRISRARHDGSVAARSHSRSSAPPSSSAMSDRPSSTVRHSSIPWRFPSLGRGGTADEEDDGLDDGGASIDGNGNGNDAVESPSVTEDTTKNDFCSEAARAAPARSHIVHSQAEVDQHSSDGIAQWNRPPPTLDSSSADLVPASAIPETTGTHTKTKKNLSYAGYDKDLIHRIHERRRLALGLAKFSSSSLSVDEGDTS